MFEKLAMLASEAWFPVILGIVVAQLFTVAVEVYWSRSGRQPFKSERFLCSVLWVVIAVATGWAWHVGYPAVTLGRYEAMQQDRFRTRTLQARTAETVRADEISAASDCEKDRLRGMQMAYPGDLLYRSDMAAARRRCASPDRANGPSEVVPDDGPQAAAVRKELRALLRAQQNALQRLPAAAP